MAVSDMRESKKLTQEELAEKVGVSRSAVAMWESKGIMPSVSVMMKLAKVLKVDLRKLIENWRR